MFGSLVEDLIHEREGFDSCSFNNINDHTSHNSGLLFLVGEHICQSTRNRSTHRVSYDNDVLVMETVHQLLQDFDCLWYDCLNWKVLKVLCLFWISVALEIKSYKSSEVLYLFGQSGKTQSWMSSSMYAEKQRTLRTSSENWRSLIYI